MSETNESQEEYNLDNFSKIEKVWYSFLTLLIAFFLGFGLFHLTPAHTVFNRIFHHPVECTIDSARSSSSSGSSPSRTYYLYISTTDCGELYKISNFSTVDKAQDLNEKKGQKITVEMGYLPWSLGGKKQIVDSLDDL